MFADLLTIWVVQVVNKLRILESLLAVKTVLIYLN